MGVIARDDDVEHQTTTTDDYRGLIDVLLLCTRCKQPIKARINTPNWLRVEWIGSEGECLRCFQEVKNASRD